MKVVVDTNFLVTAARWKIDVFEELKQFGKVEVIILSPVLGELERFPLAYQLLQRQEYTLVGAEGRADDAIYQYAKANNLPVATADAGLKRRLKDLKVPLLVLRNRGVVRMT